MGKRSGFQRAPDDFKDTLHEARLHNEQVGEYHGFPLEFAEQMPIDPNGILRNAPREQIAIH
jgi:hypothetical protein